jgi:hypothetical protein
VPAANGGSSSTATGDGVWDSAEKSVLTDASGNFSFKDLAAATYKIRVAKQTGWTLTTPTAGYTSVHAGGGREQDGSAFRRTPRLSGGTAFAFAPWPGSGILSVARVHSAGRRG